MAVDTYTATLNNQGRIESRLAFSLAGNGLRGNSSGFTPNFAFPKSLSPSSFHKRTFPEAFAAAPRDESPTAPKEDVEHQITPMDVRSLDSQSHIIEGGYGSPPSGRNGDVTTGKAGKYVIRLVMYELMLTLTVQYRPQVLAKACHFFSFK
ncbi:hypothetical protein BDP27DRAFT_530360 [Rhodocollybia butyracea]|uniref:Uncharacterized protein n=1 Tax=Rhodocollybia butyracea TaxID=206335 RepID=A0A9P5TYZ9_9AGAR|nr:hypothetical protein BDP27DRAFT_530360 [Rhodocollybia butyracea]